MSDKPENLKCPEDGAAMVPRTSKKGKSPGRKFWGCVNYPRCTGTRDTDGRSFQERRQESREWRRDNNEDENTNHD